jgi:peroxiredoxin
MTRRGTFAPIAGFALALVAATAVAAPPETKPAKAPPGHDAAPAKVKKDMVAKVGEAAPDFKLMDAQGKAYALADYKGKVVVLQWINPDCPVCKRVSSTGLVAGMLKDLKQVDPNIVHLAINSTHYMEPAATAAYMKEHKLDSPALIDREGTVGQMYGARTTPHVYVIDAEGVLRYQGAFDDDQRGNKENRTNFVVQAVRQIVAGETVTPDTTKPYGCSVKYAKKDSEKGTG